MSAASRAEARRKAILARGGDRLAKLTTSARGDDAPGFSNDPPRIPSALNTYSSVVDDAPTPPRAAPAAAPAPAVDPSVWSQDQQEQFMRALMGAGLAASGGAPPPPSQPRITGANGNGQADPAQSELQEQFTRNPTQSRMAAAALAPFLSGATPGEQGALPPGFPGFPPGMGMGMGPLGGGADGAPFAFPGMAAAAAPPKPRTLLQKLLPIVHILASFALLMYFVLWKEAEVYGARPGGATVEVDGGRWKRWAELGWRGPDAWGSAVQNVPFFPAFLTLQILLHSMRIFSGFDAVQPPMLLSLIMPSLPHPIPLIITTTLKYAQMLGALADDLAGVVVILGLGVWLAGMVSV